MIVPFMKYSVDLILVELICHRKKLEVVCMLPIIIECFLRSMETRFGEKYLGK